MQRKPTKNTRGPNQLEKSFQGWLSQQPCTWCGNDCPVIVDHAKGATFKHNKVLIGHMFCNSACVTCDTQKTIHGKRLGNEAEECLRHIQLFEMELGCECPSYVIQSIADWGK